MTEEAQPAHTHSGEYAGMHSHEGGPLHWHDEFGEHSAEDLDPEERALRELDWKKHHVELTTVGIDIGSTTSHLMFSRMYLQRLGEGAVMRFIPVGRQLLWKSPIIFTPYLDDNTIDAETLRVFVGDAFRAVGGGKSNVDTGVIILTGQALERHNARALGDLFAEHAGKFVSAAAGHHLEAVLAANGSGTVSRSRRDRQTLLNVDIGGGTTKLALVRDGEILATAAIAIGARLLAKDAEGQLVRIEGPARQVAEHLGIELREGEPLATEEETRIAQTWTDILAGLIDQQPPSGLAAELMLSDPLPADITPEAVIFSGGVSEYIFFRESKDFGDMGKPLAKTLRAALGNGTIKLPAIIDPNLGIRATAIGASQFTVQLGSNSFVSDEAVLPLRNVPVLAPHLDLGTEPAAGDVAAAIREAAVRTDLVDGAQPIALAFRWPGDLDEARVRTLAEGVLAGVPYTIERQLPVVLLADRLIGQALGSSFKEQLGVPGPVISVEGVAVHEFDYVDVGEVLHPSEAVPVTIKSLLFAGGLDRTSVKRALVDAARSVAAETRKSSSN